MTNYKKNKISEKFLLVVASVVAFSGLSLNQLLLRQSAQATSYEQQLREQQIRQLKDANSYYQKEAHELRKRADSLAGEVELINREKAQIQAVIDRISTYINQLNREINRLERAIDDNREALGDVLAKIYLSGNVSTLERLASARAITDFIDEEAQAETVRQNIGLKLQEIKQHREQISAKKAEQVKALETQKQQMAVQQKLEQEKQSILDKTRGDEAEYRRLTQANNVRIDALILEQKKANCRDAGGVWQPDGSCHRPVQAGWSGIPNGVQGGGGYPGEWAFAPRDAYVDPWGLYTRECVSYVAWKIHTTRGGVGRFTVNYKGKQVSSPVPNFMGMGHAYQWPATTSRSDLKIVVPKGSAPKVGAAAVSMVGRYGHVMYVEAVHGDGSITVSDYNLLFDGNYRIYRRSASGLIYIYF